MIGLQTLAWLDQWTLLTVAFVALLLFGRRLPEVARSLGKGISEFKKGLHDVQDEVMHEDQEREPTKPKLRAPQTDDADPVARKHLPSEEPEATSREEQPHDVSH
jgi:sec-independent protein translocase protein TatA